LPEINIRASALGSAWSRREILAIELHGPGEYGCKTGQIPRSDKQEVGSGNWEVTGASPSNYLPVKKGTKKAMPSIRSAMA
jgi:hypothetical protein